MSVERLPFIAANLKELDELLAERIAQVEENLKDERYPKGAKREIDFKIVFEGDKHDPDEIVCKLFSNVKLPARYGKMVDTCVRDGKIMVERGPEDVDMFDESIREATNKLKDHIKEAGGTVTVMRGGNVQ